MKPIIYTLQWCGHCIDLKNFLKKHNIEYIEKDCIDRDNALELIQKSKQSGVPVIDYKGEIKIGYNHDAMKRMFKVE